eukprot:TRINITY_DN376_c0_g1_i9.p1 TRINITY_DN376_c0_g1~~TRINITY_DN376_c0_g1_i9.p1  ORF type:complete len:626 (-),score=156.93 TRINITY_DN376_c0_g1_i9:126-1868(-)
METQQFASSSSSNSAYLRRLFQRPGSGQLTNVNFEDEQSFTVLVYSHVIHVAVEYLADTEDEAFVGCGGATFPANLFLSEKDRRAVCDDLHIHVSLDSEPFILFVCEGKSGSDKKHDQNKLVLESISAYRHNQITRKPVKEWEDSSKKIVLPTLYFNGPTGVIGEVRYDVLDHTTGNKPTSVVYTEFNTKSQLKEFLQHLDAVMKECVEGYKWVKKNTQQNVGRVFKGQSGSASTRQNKRKERDDDNNSSNHESRDSNNNGKDNGNDDGDGDGKQPFKKRKTSEQQKDNPALADKTMMSVCPDLIVRSRGHWHGSETWERSGILNGQWVFCKVTSDIWEVEVFEKMLSNNHALASCPGVIQPVCAGVDDETEMGAIVMPLLQPVTGFNDIIRDGFTLSERVEQLRECVLAMHKRGYMHRDIKPSNIGIDTDNRMFLFDLGLIKQVGKHKWNGEVGTERYMAPELEVNNGVYDERVDFYSAGKTIEEWVEKHNGSDFKVDPLEGQRKLIARLLEHLCAEEPERRDWPTLAQVRRESGGSEGSGGSQESGSSMSSTGKQIGEEQEQQYGDWIDNGMVVEDCK